jgi:alkyl hydroperoxide reductase subunit AhpF
MEYCATHQLRVPSESCLCVEDEGGGSVRVACVVSGGGGDVVVSGEAEHADRGVAGCGHCSGSVAGADL